MPTRASSDGEFAFPPPFDIHLAVVTGRIFESLATPDHPGGRLLADPPSGAVPEFLAAAAPFPDDLPPQSCPADWLRVLQGALETT